MNHNYIQHYQCCFRILPSDDNTYVALQKILFDWVCIKEAKGSLDKSFSEFKHIGKWESLPDTRSFIQTTICYEDSGQSWALRYEEKDREFGPRRFWYTDVGIRLIAKEIVFSTRLSFAWNDNDLSGFSQIPKTTIPKFVRDILSKGYKIYCGRPELRITDKPVVLKPGYGKGLAEWIMSRDRRHPLVVFNGSRPDLVEESKNIAFDLAGKATVLRIPEDSKLAVEIKNYLPKEFDINLGFFRVFFPFTGERLQSARHRWYDIKNEDYLNQRSGIVNGLLKNYLIYDKDAVESISSVYTRISHQKILKFRKENPEKNEELEEFYKLLNEAEKERDEFKKMADFTASQCDERETEVADLKRQLVYYTIKSNQIDALTDKLDASKNRDFFIRNLQFPRSLMDVINAVKDIHRDRLSFAPEALASAQNYKKFSAFDVAWAMLFDIANILYSIKFCETGPQAADIEKNFDERSKYQLTMTEGKLTKRDSALMASRELVFEGDTIDITPHVKWGSSEPRMLRIYFAFHDVTNRIIIGHIGQHLPTAGTRKIS